jgi:hypothetical protein
MAVTKADIRFAKTYGLVQRYYSPQPIPADRLERLQASFRKLSEAESLEPLEPCSAAVDQELASLLQFIPQWTAATGDFVLTSSILEDLAEPFQRAVEALGLTYKRMDDKPLQEGALWVEVSWAAVPWIEDEPI